jgi:uracil-DNA glycosylase family 4
MSEKLQSPTPAPGEIEIGMPTSLVARNKKVGDRLLVAGEGKIPAEIMFVATAVDEDEAVDHIKGSYGRTIPQRARYLKGAAGCILSDILASIGIDIYDHYYTAVIKWLLPRQDRNRPKQTLVAQSMPILLDEIKRVQPKIIVTFGKVAFDAVFPNRMKFDSVRAGWFYSEQHEAKIFVMQDVRKPVYEPAQIEAFRMELLELRKMLDETRGIEVVKSPEDYQIISTPDQLVEFTKMLAGEKQHLLSVDCEFGGRNHVDGRLRSLQMEWTPGRARYIRLMDDKLNIAFPGGYEAAGQILQPHCNDPKTKYIGYHISADLPWMHTWLGLDWYQKAMIDVEGAQQVLDENAELGLERLALQYTALGRYDIPLELWKLDNREKVSDDLGYLLIPDEILVPYALKDVSAPMIAAPQIIKRLMSDKTWEYYRDYRHHLVTDIFTQFALLGLPINKAKIDILRDLYSYARELLEKKFIHELRIESGQLLLKAMLSASKDPKCFGVYQEILTMAAEGHHVEAEARLKEFVMPDLDLIKHTTSKQDFEMAKAMAAETEKKVLPALHHFLEAPNFNVRSADCKKRWLFDVKGMTPVKTTNRKEAGLPSIPWSRVQNLPPHIAAQYAPACDKQTLKMLADDTQDALLRRMLDMLAVGNIAKSCFKQPQVDEFTGEIVKENGLHTWIAGDGYIHPNNSVTETGRPRGWKPNYLNWAKYIHKGVARGIAEVLKEQHDIGELPEKFQVFLDPDAIPSVRSIVDVTELPPLEGSVGWCFSDSDFATAEIRSMAFLSGDENLIRLMTEPDDQFGLAKVKDKKHSIRLRYASDCGIDEKNWRSEFILTSATNGKIEARVSWAELLRKDGKLIHPPHDLHWSLVEWVQNNPRELFDAEIDRGGTGKPGNFCIAEDELVLTGRGWIAIQNVLGCDVLWDGVAWVHHEGLKYNGIAEVRNYQGLRATDGHEVWDRDGRKIYFGQARTQQIELASIGGAGQKIECAWPDSFPRNDSQNGVGILSPDDAMHFVRKTTGERDPEFGAGFFQQVPLSEAGGACGVRRSATVDEDARHSIQCDDAALLQRHARVVVQLQDARHSSVVQISPGFCDVGVGEMAGGDIQEKGLRQDRQRRTLLERESSVGGSSDEFVESEKTQRCGHSDRTGLHGTASRGELHGDHVLRVIPAGHERVSNTGTPQEQQQGRVEKVRVYDIINAGPRNRFVCSGILVSNSTSYGATASTLDRQIKAIIGKSPPEGTGQGILDALRRRQPVAVEWLEALAEIPGSQYPEYQLESGQKRRFHAHRSFVRGMDERTKNSILSGLSRQARNFPNQAIVADTSTKAVKNLMAYYRQYGFRSYPLVILYDSVVSCGPVEERFHVAAAHQRFMTTENCWHNHGRTWNFPIDTGFTLAWGSKPSDDMKKKLNDKTWHSEAPWLKL